MATPQTTVNGAASTQPLLPRDARLIALLLAANGAEDCEEGVVRMLVEFAHRTSALPLWIARERARLLLSRESRELTPWY